MKNGQMKRDDQTNQSTDRQFDNRSMHERINWNDSDIHKNHFIEYMIIKHLTMPKIKMAHLFDVLWLTGKRQNYKKISMSALNSVKKSTIWVVPESFSSKTKKVTTILS